MGERNLYSGQVLDVVYAWAEARSHPEFQAMNKKSQPTASRRSKVHRAETLPYMGSTRTHGVHMCAYELHIARSRMRIQYKLVYINFYTSLSTPAKHGQRRLPALLIISPPFCSQPWSLQRVRMYTKNENERKWRARAMREGRIY